MSVYQSANQKINDYIELHKATQAEVQEEINRETYKDGGPDPEVLNNLHETLDHDRAIIHGLRLAQTLLYRAAMEAKESTCEPV